jgi:hypothetical protein
MAPAPAVVVARRKTIGIQRSGRNEPTWSATEKRKGKKVISPYQIPEKKKREKISQMAV